MKTTELGRTGRRISTVGQGLNIGNYKRSSATYDGQVENIRSGIRLGMTLLDTAPVYGEGKSELVTGRAIKGVDADVCLATKLVPGKTSGDEVRKTAKESLKRLRVDALDLLQVHWPNPTIPMLETMDALTDLVDLGLVVNIGLSNFSLDELIEAVSEASVPISSVQLEYNLFDRSIEQDVLPYCQANGITILAYSPLHRGRIANGPDHLEVLKDIASRHGASPAQVLDMPSRFVWR